MNLMLAAEEQRFKHRVRQIHQVTSRVATDYEERMRGIIQHQRTDYQQVIEQSLAGSSGAPSPKTLVSHEDVHREMVPEPEPVDYAPEPTALLPTVAGPSAFVHGDGGGLPMLPHQHYAGPPAPAPAPAPQSTSLPPLRDPPRGAGAPVAAFNKPNTNWYKQSYSALLDQCHMTPSTYPKPSRTMSKVLGQHGGLQFPLPRLKKTRDVPQKYPSRPNRIFGPPPRT